ncbi:von_Willebrand factor A-like domain superfamily [Hexamita inflata]|uniref:von Willebrand factor A-like domain superfamily n=1 Tax=Hexamita inflata TaxID=28002 RepID=A0AA86R8D3_9EUKA|nr:von Willebrand factor A-like domain superfamily [Hexamita inflata]
MPSLLYLNAKNKKMEQHYFANTDTIHPYSMFPPLIQVLPYYKQYFGIMALQKAQQKIYRCTWTAILMAKQLLSLDKDQFTFSNVCILSSGPATSGTNAIQQSRDVSDSSPLYQQSIQSSVVLKNDLNITYDCIIASDKYLDLIDYVDICVQTGGYMKYSKNAQTMGFALSEYIQFYVQRLFKVKLMVFSQNSSVQISSCGIISDRTLNILQSSPNLCVFISSASEYLQFQLTYFTQSGSQVIRVTTVQHNSKQQTNAILTFQHIVNQVFNNSLTKTYQNFILTVQKFIKNTQENESVLRFCVGIYNSVLKGNISADDRSYLKYLSLCSPLQNIYELYNQTVFVCSKNNLNIFQSTPVNNVQTESGFQFVLIANNYQNQIYLITDQINSRENSFSTPVQAKVKFATSPLSNNVSQTPLRNVKFEFRSSQILLDSSQNSSRDDFDILLQKPIEPLKYSAEVQNIINFYPHVDIAINRLTDKLGIRSKDVQLIYLHENPQMVNQILYESGYGDFTQWFTTQ